MTTALLNFGGNNIISGDIRHTDDGGFTGKIDARFYGPVAREFGGTFAVSDASNNQYYGMFGTEINKDEYSKIFDDPVSTQTLGNNVPATTTAPVTNFDTAFANSTSYQFTGLKTLGVERFFDVIHTRDASEIGNLWSKDDVSTQHTIPYPVRFRTSDDAALDVRITTHFNQPRLYFGENNLYADQGSSSSVVGFAGDIGSSVVDGNGVRNHQYTSPYIADNVIYLARNLNGSIDNGSFNSKYMIFMRWEGRKREGFSFGNEVPYLDPNLAEDTTYSAWAYAIAGFETDYANIPTTGSAVFKGNGFAHYTPQAVSWSHA